MKAKDLRNSILQMAVQGKLVPQDPNDEPASVLLERIRAERAKLIKEKKIKAPKGGESVIYRASDGSHYEKRGKGEPVCIDDEIPFEIPESWEWVRLGSIIALLSGQDFETKDYNSAQKGIPYFTGASNIDNGSLIVNRWTEKPRCLVTPGNLLVVCKGAGVGKMAIVPNDIKEAHIARQIMAIDCMGHCAERYLSFFIEVQLKLVREQMQGVIPGISRDVLLSMITPVPPFGEQLRIIAKLDVISSLVSDYAALEDARQCLDAELPDRLRKSILQLAVQGKLVEQDPADEPAAVLLDRIRAERAALVKTKKLKAPKGGESIIYRASDGGYYEKRSKGEPQPIEVPFDIPESWEWARIGSVFDMQAGKNIATANISDIQDEKHPYPCFGGNGIRGYVQEPNRNGRYPIVGRQGALCGCVNYAEGEFYATEHAVVTTCFDKTDVSWACIVLEALNLNQYATATAQPGLAVSKIVDVFIPVPPAGEQARIAEVYEAYKRFTNQ